MKIEVFASNLSRIFAFVFVLIIVFTHYSQASDFHSPRTTALGGAGHASPLLSDAIYLNPSYSSMSSLHSLSFNYPFFPEGHILNLSVLDGSSDSLFQAGAGYTRREDVSLIHIGASKGVSSAIGVGLGSKFIFPNDTSGQRIADATLSVTWIMADWLQSALIIDNLFAADPSRGFHRELILGNKVTFQNVMSLFVDPHWFTSLDGGFGYELGAEFPFFSDFFFRVGTFKNASLPSIARLGEGFSFGAGWVAPRLALDYGFSRSLTPDSYVHNFGMTVYF